MELSLDYLNRSAWRSNERVKQQLINPPHIIVTTGLNINLTSALRNYQLDDMLRDIQMVNWIMMLSIIQHPVMPSMLREGTTFVRLFNEITDSYNAAANAAADEMVILRGK